MGISAPATGVAGLSGALHEAGSARRLAALRGTTAISVVTSDEVASHELLLAAVPGSVLRSFRDRLVGPLIAHDQRHRAELLPTLREFLACSGSWSACVTKMCIHVNTVRHRIRRIEELTGRDLSSLDDQVDFFLALRIRQRVRVVVIRSASAADAAQVAAVQREGWFAAYDGIITREVIDRVTTPDDGARLRQTFRTRPWQRMMVAVAEPSGIVGYASFGPELDVLGASWPHPPTKAGAAGQAAELYALYVHPDWWSTGTGRALMDQALARTTAAGYADIVLWALRDNARARRFYERAGFSPDGAGNVLDGLGGVEEVRYRRPLSA